MKYYAAYGSNLHLEQMKERCPNAIPIGTARLADWKLVFKGDKGEFYLSIVPKKGAFADAGIWQVDAQDEAALDEYEEYPALYKKFTLDLPVSFLTDIANLFLCFFTPFPWALRMAGQKKSTYKSAKRAVTTLVWIRRLCLRLWKGCRRRPARSPEPGKERRSDRAAWPEQQP